MAKSNLKVKKSEQKVDLKVVDNIYGLNTIIPAEQAVIDKTTGHTLEEDTGYISETNKNVNVTLETFEPLFVVPVPKPEL